MPVIIPRARATVLAAGKACEEAARYMLQRLRAAVRWAPARCSLQAECEPEWTALQRLLQARVHVRSEGAPEEAASTGIPDTLPLAGKDTDWREFRARLVASQGAATGSPPGSAGDAGAEAGAEPPVWAHHIPGPERGCLLIAHPQLFNAQQTYFHQAVILLLDHGREGTQGLILNKRTEHRLRDVLGAEMLCPEFTDNPLYLGGDVDFGTLRLLHAHAGLPGAIPIVGGLWQGGFEAAQERVRAGQLDPQSFRIFTRVAGWGPGQLEGECAAGVWYTAAASAGLALDAAPGADAWQRALELMGQRDSFFRGLLEAVRAGEHLDPGSAPPAADGDPAKP